MWPLETQIRSLSPFLNPRSRLGLQADFMEEVSVRLKLFPVKFLGVMNSRWSSDIVWRLNDKNPLIQDMLFYNYIYGCRYIPVK